MNDDQLRAALQAEYLHLPEGRRGHGRPGRSPSRRGASASASRRWRCICSKAADVLLLACVSAVLFWWLEARWKTFQDAYYGRIDAIECHFRGEQVLPSALQIRASWYENWNGGSRKRLWQIMIWPHVALLMPWSPRLLCCCMRCCGPA